MTALKSTPTLKATGVELPLAEIALRDLAAGLGVPHTTSTTKG